jgi:type VI secretion system protein ImpL
MKKKQKTILLSAILLVLLIAWFIPPRLKLTGADLWLVRGGIAVLGLSGVAVYWIISSRKAATRAAVAQPGGPADEIGMLARESERRMAASASVKGAKLSTLPAILVIGETGSAKTSTVMQSGLEPELMAGQAMQNGTVAPTRSVNFWLAQRNVLVDVGGGALSDLAVRDQLVKWLRPSSPLFAKGDEPARVAVVCVDIESFLRPGGAEATVQSARAIREALGEISAGWGINLPVYVLFTKMDRMPYFLEYVNTFTNEEAGLILGSTLSMHETATGGVYVEGESKRLTECFQSLIYSLAEKRPEFLAREHDPAKLPGSYQFAREMRKLRSLVVQYLIELGRPSQLRTNPFLRGFYFTGVRPIIVSDVMASRRVEEKQPLLTDATGIFRPGQSVPDAAQQATGRKVPQWVFLPHFFPAVVLKDGAALGSSSGSLKTDFVRRLLFLGAGLVSLFLIIAWLISFGNNRALAKGTEAAATAIPTTPIAEGQLASVDSLEKLEALRQRVAMLRDHHINGPPWGYRWGLYSGNGLYPAATRVYFGHFRRLLLAQTQGSLLQLMSQPAAQSLGYRPVYDGLKAYLITTSHPDKSTPDFLPGVLMEHWLKGRTVDPKQSDLARQQFVFFAEHLQLSKVSPYPSYSRPEARAVSTARAYLTQFAGAETIYAAMLAAASQKFSNVSFNRAYPGAAEAIRNNYVVAGAFTKGGYEFMQNAIANPNEFFSGEKWVMGDAAVATNIDDPAKLKADLKARYRDDFLKQWRAYLAATQVLPFGLQDSPARLTKLTDVVSPLLGVLCLASMNTAVEDKSIADIFQPAQAVTPAPACQEKLSAPSNGPYMEKLITLKADLQSVVGSPSDDSLKRSAIATANSAQVAAQLMAQQFRPDKEGQTHAVVQKVLEDPIIYVQRAIGDMAAGPFNAAGAGLCSQWRALTSKYPFNPKSTQEATLAEVAALFAPKTGEVAKLNELVTKLPDGVVLNPPFQAFLRQATAVSEAFYKGGSATPNLVFALKPFPTEGIRQVKLNIHGQTLTSSGAGNPMQFSWPGTGAQQVQLQVNIGTDLDYPSYKGLWALFRFFADGQPRSAAGSAFSLEWTLRTAGGPVTIPRTGNPVTVRFDLDMLGAPPILRPGYLASISCVPVVVRRAGSQ